MRKLILSLVVVTVGVVLAGAGCGSKSSKKPDDTGNTGVTPVCGNGKVEAPEECDYAISGQKDGCSTECKAKTGYECTTSGSCEVKEGWVCPPGKECHASQCGDGIVAGTEKCDEGTDPSGGCDDKCQIMPQDQDGNGWVCPPAGGKCTPTLCGNGVVEGNKQCDWKASPTAEEQTLGATLDLPHDGCYKCMVEPVRVAGQPQSVCGNGLIEPGESCDDQGQGGCNDTCTAPASDWTCEVKETVTAITEIPIILRDFIGIYDKTKTDLINTDPRAHPDFEQYENDLPEGDCNKVVKELVLPTLGDDGKPVANPDHTYGQPKVPDCQHQIYSVDRFKEWYTATSSTNMTFVDKLILTDLKDGRYVFDSDAIGGLFPLDGKGFDDGYTPKNLEIYESTPNHNFNFTTEARVWFTYQGQDEKLDFSGDDDVWVFINGHLAMDLGGHHGKEPGEIILNQAKATEFGLEVNGVYEMALFHAERHTSQSNFKLTLMNFVTKTSECTYHGGDGY